MDANGAFFENAHGCFPLAGSRRKFAPAAAEKPFPGCWLPENARVLARKTLTLSRQKLGCAVNAPADGPAPDSLISEVLQMAKAVTIKVKLVSTADTGFYYVAKKNSRTMTDKLVKKKYDPVARKHVEFKEAKIK